MSPNTSTVFLDDLCKTIKHPTQADD